MTHIRKFIDRRPLIRGSRIFTADEIEFLYPMNSSHVKFLKRAGRLQEYYLAGYKKPYYFRENDIIAFLTAVPEKDQTLPQIAEVIGTYQGEHVTMALILCPYCADRHFHPMVDQYVPATCDPSLDYYVFGSETLNERQQAIIDQGRVYLYKKQRGAMQRSSHERQYEMSYPPEGTGNQTED